MSRKIILYTDEKDPSYEIYLENNNFYSGYEVFGTSIRCSINNVNKWLADPDNKIYYRTSYPIIKEYMESLTIEAPELLN